MKSRSKRNRKRPRGGIGCLAEDDDDGNNSAKSPHSLLRVEEVPLSTAFDVISDATTRGDGERQRRTHDGRRVRIIHPYPFTFGTFAKARWIGRTVVNVYHEEFGSYPRSYYEAAIKAGRILVSGKRVDCDYEIKGGDELTHTVHRHEPAVGLADDASSGNDETTTIAPPPSPPPVRIVHEDGSLLVVDKPATLPVHPCGGYNFNSLFEVLGRWKPEAYGGPGKLFTVHRLDRLTSGLVLIAKTSAVARALGKCIMDRDGCEKIYLSRVKGRFPANLRRVDVVDGESDNHHPWEYRYVPVPADCRDELGGQGCDPNNKRMRHSIPPPCQYGEFDPSNASSWRGGSQILLSNGARNKKNQKGTSNDTDNGNKPRSYAGFGYWMTDGHGTVVDNSPLQDLIDQCENVSMEEMLAGAIGSSPTNETDRDPPKQSMRWLNFSCPCRISSHKNGVCEAGDFSDLDDESDRKGIKPAQTSFALLSYDAASDTSLVLARPVTGRTHQIRLHLQKLGHPIANDRCYGGEPWFGEDEGERRARVRARAWLDRLDGVVDSPSADGGAGCRRTNADTPATEAEVYHAAADGTRDDGESMLDFIEKTCVWCARCRGVDGIGAWGAGPEAKLENERAVFRRTLMEYLVRSQGIWLHALQYSLKTVHEGGRNDTVCYRTELPSWATM